MRLALLLIGLTLSAQVPGEDRRNTWTPNTDTVFEAPSFASLAEWETRKTRLRSQILAATGLLPMPERNPLRPRIFGKLTRQGYSIEKVLIETLPGYYLGGNLYRPATPGRHPGILKPHGHWRYGRLENTDLGAMNTLSANLALQGYVVFAYDMVGYNDTIQTPHNFLREREQLWSFTPLGLQTWNSIRALDFLQSLEDVDPERIAATGASGGGTQTFLLYAIDDRVKWAAPVNMISHIMQGGSPCENAPGLRLGTSNVEIGAMMAPRPLMMVSATGDWTRNTPQMEYPAIRGVFALYDKAALVETTLIDAPHNYNKASREAVYRFFAKHIQGSPDAASVAEKNTPSEMLQDMLALHNRRLPAGALNYDELFAQWREAAVRQTRGMENEELRDRLRLALGVEPIVGLKASRQGDHVILARAQAGDRVPGRWFPGKGKAVLLVHPEGSAAAKAELEELRRAGRPVLAIDAFQTGEAKAARDRSHRYFTTFNRTDDQNRVQDIVTALAYLSAEAPGPVELRASGDAAIWALFAAAVAERPQVELVAPLEGFNGSDDDFLKRFFVPGIQRAGGLEAALRLVR